MTIEIKHKFASQKPDGSDASLIRPSNWNDTHNINLAGQRLLGRSATGQGAAQEISVGGGIEFNGTQLALVTGIWTGTQAQYNAIATKDANTLYFIR